MLMFRMVDDYGDLDTGHNGKITLDQLWIRTSP
jgi:hypothetical protein